MPPWKSIQLPDCLIEHKVGRNNQINSADIQRTGCYPVVDQGKNFVAGFTDEPSRVVRQGLPYVIFGDHTRCFKYVDFPFVLGADGTKVLKPNPDLFDTKFFYYAALSLNIPSRGYNRHFTLLKEKLIPRPELPEQRQIAQVLSAVQGAIERQERLIAITAELKKALMHKLFSEGTRGEPLKQTEIGLVPKNWQTPIIGKFVDIAHGYAFQSSYFTKAGPVVLTPGNFKLDGGLYWGDRTKYTTEAPPNGFTLHAGDLVVVMTDLTPSAKLLGTPAFIPGEMVILHNQRIGKVVMKQSGTTLDYLYWVFLTERFKRYMASTATGSTVRHTSPSRIRDYRFPLPKGDEQCRIIEVLKTCDRKCAAHEATRSALDALFRSLLHQFMTAQVRAHDLDLSALEEPAAKMAEVT